MLSLHHGDCLEVMKDIPDKSVNLIICDLPYGCLAQPHGAIATGHTKLSPSTAGCAWDVPIDLEAFWKEVRRIRKDDHTPTIHFCTTKFGYELIKSNEKEFRYDLIFDKQKGVSFLSANKMPMRSHESIYIFSKAGATYYRKDVEGNFKSYDKRSKAEECSHFATARKASKQEEGKRCALSVISVMNNPKANVRTKRHPTEKPIELYKWLIQRYSKEGDTILDPTFGSGNSVFTAVELGRKAIGIEKDKGFYDKAKEKFEEHNSSPANLDGPV
jgi:site-specific DNA-methyltransferase (adenine-specific)